MSSDREPRSVTRQRVPLLVASEDFRGRKNCWVLDKSSQGLGGLSLGLQFPGKGERVSCSGGDFIIRWVQVHFGFIYRFGLEAAS